jgi:hypothetical protein
VATDEESHLLCDESNFPKVLQIIDQLCSKVSHTHNIRIVINQTILYECLLKARQTIEFYGSGFDFRQIAINKEAAHIAFWINKLKPCSIASPSFELKSFGTYFNRIAGDLSGNKTEIQNRIKSLENIAKSAASAENEIKYNFPINENIAFSFAVYVVRVSQMAELNRISPLSRSDVEKQIELNRIRLAESHQNIIAGLRYYNFSARGFAMLIGMATHLHGE